MGKARGNLESEPILQAERKLSPTWDVLYAGSASGWKVSKNKEVT
jgi:hypothetical protein